MNAWLPFMLTPSAAPSPGGVPSLVQVKTTNVTPLVGSLSFDSPVSVGSLILFIASSGNQPFSVISVDQNGEGTYSEIENQTDGNAHHIVWSGLAVSTSPVINWEITMGILTSRRAIAILEIEPALLDGQKGRDAGSTSPYAAASVATAVTANPSIGVAVYTLGNDPGIWTPAPGFTTVANGVNTRDAFYVCVNESAAGFSAERALATGTINRNNIGSLITFEGT